MKTATVHGTVPCSSIETQNGIEIRGARPTPLDVLEAAARPAITNDRYACGVPCISLLAACPRPPRPNRRLNTQRFVFLSICDRQRPKEVLRAKQRAAGTALASDGNIKLGTEARRDAIENPSQLGR